MIEKIKKFKFLYSTIGIVLFVLLMCSSCYFSMKYLNSFWNNISCIITYCISYTIAFLLALKDFKK